MRLGVSRATWTTLAAVALIAAVIVVYAIWRGQDVNWDQRNYHVYDAWALLNGKSFSNLWPAQMQTFFNPLASLVPYTLIGLMPPMAAGAALALIHAVNAGLVLIIARRFFGQRWLHVGAALVIGITGPMFLSEIGTTFADISTSVLVLGGVLAALLHVERRATGTAAIAGLLLGLATGLKLTNAMYLAGLVIYPWWMHGKMSTTLRTFLAFAAAALAGLFLTHGYWSVLLWEHYDSPLFPLYNGIFQSSWLEAANIADRRFLPTSVLDAASYPLQWLLGQHPSSELQFRDARFAVALVLALVAGTVAVARRAREMDPQHHEFWLLGGFTIISFTAWISLFGISRYLIPLELLSGVLIVRQISCLTRDRLAGPIVAATAIALVLWTIPPNWGRVSWTDSWYDVRVPAELQSANELFVMLGGDPISYVVPYLPHDATVVRLGGNLDVIDVAGRGRLRDLAQATIDAHLGPVFTLSVATPDEASLSLLSEFGLHPDVSACFTLATRVQDLMSCSVNR